MQHYKIIDHFTKQMNYLNNEKVIGIIFYGSYQTHTENPNSDIDLLIIFNDESKPINVRGGINIDGYFIEYYEKDISMLYKRIEKDFYNSEDTMNSVIGYGEILLDKDGSVKKLKENCRKIYLKKFKKLDDNDQRYYIRSLYGDLSDMQFLIYEDNQLYEMVYYNFLTKIKKIYEKINGYSNIADTKVIKIYKENKYREAQKKRIPDISFVNLYIKALFVKKRKEKLLISRQLYEMVNKDNIFNKDEYRINLKDKMY